MKPEILVIPEMLEPLCGELGKDFRIHRYWELASIDDLGQDTKSIRGIATNGQCGAGTGLIGSLPALEIVSCHGVGVDAIDLDAARERKIVVTTTPDVLTDDVADMALALILASVREILIGDRFVRSGKWLEGEKPVAQRVGGKRLGILGLGRAGRAVAHRAEAFNMEIAYSDQNPIPDVAYPFFADAETLAKESDLLVVTCAATPETKGMVNRSVIDALGPTGTLINVARGSIVDEDALVSALKDGRLGAAALDVFASEPNVPVALREMNNVILQPHQASGTRQCREEMADLVIRNLRGHLLGDGAITPLWK